MIAVVLKSHWLFRVGNYFVKYQHTLRVIDIKTRIVFYYLRDICVHIKMSYPIKTGSYSDPNSERPLYSFVDNF